MKLIAVDRDYGNGWVPSYPYPANLDDAFTRAKALLSDGNYKTRVRRGDLVIHEFSTDIWDWTCANIPVGI